MSKRDIGRSEPEALIKRRVITLKSQTKMKSPVVILKGANFKRENTQLLVDTGAEINLIKQKCIKSEMQINSREKVTLFGIGPDPVPTFGEVQITFKNTCITFHVVPNNFAIEQDGLLGMEFLTDHDAIIYIRKGVVTTDIGCFSFQLSKAFILPARTRKIISVPVENHNVDIGYLARINAGPGIFLGENLVKQENGHVKIYCINTTNRDIQLTLPPVEIEECSVVKPGPRTPRKAEPKQDIRSTNGKRLVALLKELDITGNSDEEKKSILKSISGYLYQFRLQGDPLTHTTVLKHKINTTDDKPVHQRQYRHPPEHNDVVIEQSKELLENGTISPSNSPYNSPVWVVPKKPDSNGNRRWRMVIDYRALNEKTIGDAYPLPNITAILDQLGKSKYFSVLDLASGFHQIEVEPTDRHKTAFSTPYGHFQFNRMPFGLKNAPASFQRLMDQVLSGLQGNEVFVYMDDIVVYANSLKQHEQKLRNLLERLKTAGLLLQPEKCKFLCKEISYLGHVITNEGVKPDPKKTEAVANFPRPRNSKNIKQFLGLAGYYRRFVRDFANIARPLTNLLKKEKQFQWDQEQEDAFIELKTILCTEPLLQYPDFTQPFVITTDASGYALGAVLSQGPIGKDLPVAYASRTLNGAEINYSTTEKELLAIVFAVKQFRPYVFGRRFSLVTDHRPLIWLHNLKDPGSRLARWKIWLSEYDYDIQYKPGRVNSNADALSRNPVTDDKDSCTIPQETGHRVLNLQDHPPDAESDSLFDEYPIERVFLCTGAIDPTEHVEMNHVIENESALDLTEQTETNDVMEIESDDSGNERKSDRKKIVKMSEKMESGSIIPSHGEACEDAPGKESSAGGWRSDHEGVSVCEGTPVNVGFVPEVLSKCGGVVPSRGGEVPLGESSMGYVRLTRKASVVTLQCGKDDKLASVEKGIVSMPGNKGIVSMPGDKGIVSMPSEQDLDRTKRPKKRDTSEKESDTDEIVKKILKSDPRSKDVQILRTNPKSLLKPLIQNSSDKLVMRDDNKINFISVDCILTTPVGREMMNEGMFILQNLKREDPELGQVVVSQHQRNYIFHMFVREKFDSNVFTKHIELAMMALKQATEALDVKTFSVSRNGNGLDKISWILIEKMFRAHFGGEEYQITICA